MARPVIALLTDFGTRDHYAGTMKGVALGICPDVTLVDISHEIEAHDVLGGALELAAAYRYFPAGTIFLVVVDPGVGSTRRGIAAETGDYRFVAPDNGVLTAVLDEHRAEASGRADRAEVRAAHRQPHVRRARSLRAGGGVARQGHRSRGARTLGRRDPAARHPAAGARLTAGIDGAGAARRPLRQPDHATSIAGRSRRSPAVRWTSASGRTRSRASSRPTPTRRRRGLRAVRQHRSSRGGGQRRQRRRGARSAAAARPCTSPAAHDRIPRYHD